MPNKGWHDHSGAALATIASTAAPEKKCFFDWHGRSSRTRGKAEGEFVGGPDDFGSCLVAVRKPRQRTPISYMSSHVSEHVEPIGARATPRASSSTYAFEAFARLAQTWKAETGHLSSITKAAMHPAYQRIIGLGPVALPSILCEIKEEPRQWFWALKAISGEDPVEPADRGNVLKMREAWLQWGRAHGHIR